MSKAEWPHGTIEELLAADVLGGLDELDRRRLERELERHGRDCAECHRLLVQYSEVAGSLSLTVEPAPLSDAAEDRLMDLARRSGRIGAAGPVVVAEGPAEEPQPSPTRARPRRWLPAAIGVAAALALIAGTVGYELAPRGPSVPSGFLAFLAQPGTKTIQFPSRSGQQLAVAVQPGRRAAWVFGSGLPEPPNGRVYELWFQPEANGKMRPAGIFTPQDGRVAVPVTVGTSFVALAVSVEPPGGSAQPTTTPIFVTPS
jgi:hypothetical protein